MTPLQSQRDGFMWVRGGKFDSVMMGKMSGAINTISVNGRTLALEKVLDATSRFSNEQIAELKQELLNAKPFPHLVIDGLFDEELLAAASDDFPDHLNIGRNIDTPAVRVRRSLPFPKIGPAATLYFNLANSTRMVEFLSRVTGIEGLIADASLENGGLHISGPGDLFGIHRDFSHSRTTWLLNRFAMMTYLNRDWKDEYNGNLELWDFETRSVRKSIAPIFGRTVILPHGAKNFHGHPHPLTPPEGVFRKSLANYYYSSEMYNLNARFSRSSIMLDDIKNDKDLESDFRRNFNGAGWKSKAVLLARRATPPLLWPVLDRIEKISEKAKYK